jgi:hypothetical protein
MATMKEKTVGSKKPTEKYSIGKGNEPQKIGTKGVKKWNVKEQGKQKKNKPY